MPQWVEVERVEAIRPGRMRDYELLDGTILGVANVAGVFFAFDATCPHEGGPLKGGELDAGIIRCPWHGYRFRLSDGHAVTPESDLTIRRFPVRLRGGWIEVEIP